MDFKIFFSALNDGANPFPWQREAARRLTSGEPLTSISVPTGCGKTAMIEAALYHATRGGPRRIFFVIDRRVVVDQAFARAEHIGRILASPGDPELAEIADRLGPIKVIRLRGGVHTDQDWIWHPEATVIVVSTVDQIGSRLLFRGYGVTRRSWPLHAAFVGNKAVYLLDEAHQSQPFLNTVDNARALGADVRLISMTATPANHKPETLTLSTQDYEHVPLRPRLMATKTAKLATVPSSHREVAAAMAEFADQLAEPGAVIGIVANTVKAARAVHDALLRRRHESKLLIGRTRPFDRDRLMQKLLPRIRVGRQRRDDGTPLFVVATQTIEVGADLDFDALITEAAPLSALRQRFGRLDRLGLHQESNAVICVRERDIDPAKADKALVYGIDVSHTWNWLQQVAIEGRVDFGISAMNALLATENPPLEQAPACPALLPPHLHALANTGVIAPQIDPAPWLHGPLQRSTEVSVIWRAGLAVAPENDIKTDNDDSRAVRQMQLLPPHPFEAVQIPIGALRDLLSSSERVEIADLEGSDSNTTPIAGDVTPVLRWRGRDDCKVIPITDVKPGDTVIVPTDSKGLDPFGWAPTGTKDAVDIAEHCIASTARHGDDQWFCLRITQTPRPIWDLPDEKRLSDQDWARLTETANELRITAHTPDEEGDIDEERIDDLRQALRETLASIDYPLVSRLGDSYVYSFDSDGPDAVLYLYTAPVVDLDGATTGGKQVTLADHLAGVAARANELARADPNKELVVEAGAAHDLGKKAFPFQAMLYGHPSRVNLSTPLAKSGIRRRDELNAAYRASGLPKRFRHELYSVDLSPQASPLVRHLIGTHHGHGRPWFPACADANAPGASIAAVGSSWAEQMAELIAELGPWRLAELELLVRAADIRRTMEEQMEKQQ